MINFYDYSIVPIILDNFKVSKIIITGTFDEKLIREIIKYDASIISIGFKCSDDNINFTNGNPLDILPTLNDYDAIFINDDPNWYTIYNELNIIKRNNSEFPLVFVCNNRFPHKNRDAYTNPNRIPENFLQEYTNKFPICYNNKKIFVEDGFFHANNESTSKNGVMVAINDFLVENNNVGILNINFIEEITILYPKTTISKIRIDKIFESIKTNESTDVELSDKIVENQLLFSYIDKFNENLGSHDDSEYSSKDKLINDYLNKIELHDVEMDYKNSQMRNVQTKLNLKESQIKQFEYKLMAKENEITALEKDIQSKNNYVDALKNKIKQKEQDYLIKESTLINQLEDNIAIVNSQKKDIENKDNQIKFKERELVENQNRYSSLKKQYNNQFSKLDNNKYCISCFKEEINNNNFEINYLKQNGVLKKILSPVSYIYLILKSSPKEISINLKLLKILKNSKCFDIGFYLCNNKDIQNSKWCKYFSPELHYVCYGFSENRKFNKKYFNLNSKKELLEYLLNCGDV